MVGDEDESEGAKDDPPVVPVLPVFPLLAVLPELPVALWAGVLLPPDVTRGEDEDELDEEMDEVEPAFDAALPPGCSRATATPIATVAPVAAMTTPLVSARSRDCVRTLDSGVWGDSSAGICGLPPGAGRFHSTSAESMPSQGRLWACCDIVTVPLTTRAVPATGRAG
jgi:hypothetical protein